MAVLWSGVRMSADRPNRDGSRRPVTAADGWCGSVSDGLPVRERFRKYSLRCYGVG